MNESAEDYIKTIYILMRRNACVHSVDIARELGFSRASVSAAMTNLRGKEIIVMKKNGEIEFTEMSRLQRMMRAGWSIISAIRHMTGSSNISANDRSLSEK
ncbi:Iron dependent repressor, N-terminal DNA binding domain [Lachnospiraceae bacterium XBB2008]|nr:Iron dependent repressor, N-terminal DNA binding domain [Lachnospiraceae bacterium XBB2008]